MAWVLVWLFGFLCGMYARAGCGKWVWRNGKLVDTEIMSMETFVGRCRGEDSALSRPILPRTRKDP